MKREFKKIDFKEKNESGFQFDLVNIQDILKQTPADHNQFEFHRINFYAILLVTENKAKYSLNFIDYRLKKGTLFLLRKDNIHKFHNSNVEGVLLIFTENFIVKHSNKLQASKIFLLFNEMLASPKLQLSKDDYNEIITYVNLIKQEFFEVNDDYSPNIARNLMQVVITKLFRIKSKDNQIFENNRYLSMFLELQALVEKNCFTNKKVSFYANELAVSTKTLNNVTQSIIQKSVKAFIIDIVIIQSKRLIINSQDSLTEISYILGFDEPTNFFKYFAKYTGQSPSQFREAHQST